MEALFKAVKPVHIHLRYVLMLPPEIELFFNKRPSLVSVICGSYVVHDGLF